jgi:hypothetical protein
MLVGVVSLPEVVCNYQQFDFVSFFNKKNISIVFLYSDITGLKVGLFSDKRKKDPI